jgi:hypothetical protein
VPTCLLHAARVKSVSQYSSCNHSVIFRPQLLLVNCVPWVHITACRISLWQITLLRNLLPHLTPTSISNTKHFGTHIIFSTYLARNRTIESLRANFVSTGILSMTGVRAMRWRELGRLATTGSCAEWHVEKFGHFCPSDIIGEAGTGVEYRIHEKIEISYKIMASKLKFKRLFETLMRRKYYCYDLKWILPGDVHWFRLSQNRTEGLGVVKIVMNIRLLRSLLVWNEFNWLRIRSRNGLLNTAMKVRILWSAYTLLTKLTTINFSKIIARWVCMLRNTVNNVL